MHKEAVNNRLGEYLKFKGLNYSQFEKAVGLSNGLAGKIIDKGVGVGSKVIEKIFYALPDLNIDWLMTGRGSMIMKLEGAHLNEPLSAHLNASLNASPSASLTIKKDIIPTVITVDEVGDDNIVFVDRKAAAGYPLKVNEPTFFGDLPAFKLPSGEFRNGVYRAWEVEGDSMETTLHAGDWLITRFLDTWEGITDGYVHVVVTQDQVLVKRVLNRIKKNNRLILQSDNPVYGNVILEAEEVREIWIVKRFFSAILGNRNRQMEALVNNLIAETSLLKEQMADLERKVHRIKG